VQFGIDGAAIPSRRPLLGGTTSFPLGPPISFQLGPKAARCKLQAAGKVRAHRIR